MKRNTPSSLNEETRYCEETRHCERSEAIQDAIGTLYLDCVATLAMT